MEQKTLVIIVAIVVVLGGGWYLMKGSSAKAPVAPTETQAPADTTPTALETPNVTVTYTDQGFSPASITVPVGATVNFVNQSSKKMWVASAMHPSHVVYSGTSLAEHCPDTAGTAFDECKGDDPGASFSFTFTKEGTWKYHDHIDSTKYGSVIVAAGAAQ